MRLRNKKTGEIKSIEEIIRDAFLYNELDSLKSIDANWEYYIPAEPCIKDEKIRKFVRDWASFNNIKKADIIRLYREESWYKVRGEDEAGCFWAIEIHAPYSETISSVYDGCMVTITELCGEEEE